MTVKEQIAIFDSAVRLQIIKDGAELWLGYLANFQYCQDVEAILEAEVIKFKAIPDIKHKQWKEKNLMKPLEPNETPQYSFSDLQMSLYYTIYI